MPIASLPGGGFLFQASILNLAKFGTIVFFVISGYLFQHKFDNYVKRKRDFLKNKYTTLLRPYVLVFAVPTIAYIFCTPHIQPYNTLNIPIFINRLLHEIFFTNYWFIPTLFLYFFINLFIPTAHLTFFLCLSLVITLFWSANIYIKFLPFTAHTVTGLGFMSAFILGRMICLRKGFSICNNNARILGIIVIGSYAASMIESYLIYFKIHEDDFVNTLRLSNILFSLSVLEALNRVFRKKTLPLEIVQANTYFIYLFHFHFIRILMWRVFRIPLLRVLTSTENPYLFFLMPIFLTSIFIYCCFLFEKFSRKKIIKDFALQDAFFKERQLRPSTIL